ncbi:dihydrofolate reductase [Lacticaseibacillus daqingensis]|uniref:dihydrofolate reductase n=1 Tax=Lacticaseibacillus daqingensis TaxID=2486014 RepID=UPI000F78AD52|nr:dihydrofolate reductase [Lacticaseibacillus daqingensis]
MIAYVWAQASNGTIGRDGTLPWHLPDDLQFFKQKTLGQLTLMGRTTYDGLRKRPLPNRTNVVLTRRLDYTAPGAVVVHSKAEALALAAAHPEQDLMIVGGAQVFTLFADVVDTLYVTRLAGEVSGDVVMPPLDWDAFERVSARLVPNDDPALAHTFETWQRRN